MKTEKGGEQERCSLYEYVGSSPFFGGFFLELKENKTKKKLLRNNFFITHGGQNPALGKIKAGSSYRYIHE